MALSLRNSIELHIEYDDRTPFGTMISGQLEARLKRRFRPAVELLRQDPREAIERGFSLLPELGPRGEFFGAREKVRRELAFPVPADAYPAALRVDRPNQPPVKIAVPKSLARDLASWLSDWQRGAAPPASGKAKALWNGLNDLGCFGRPVKPASLRGAATFVGHATVLLSGPRTKLLIDPFLLPRNKQFPKDYQPLSHGDLAPDAILITHSHRDHFHVDTLLRLGKDTPIIVPEVSRESALAVDMVYRLKELGFTRVRPLRWHAESTIGDFRVIALPFYGEQPTTEDVRNPEIRNVGNNYLIEGQGRRYAFVADAGRDRLGDVRSVATLAYERYGPVDVLFGGYRSWSLYPIQYIVTSVPQFLLFTPRSLWMSRQQIMNDAHGLLDTAERWHARYVVPYADGGAPWYWQLDLGPRADREDRTTNVYFDPRPEAVVQAAASRSESLVSDIPSPAEPLLMRPGESLDFGAQGEAKILSNAGHVWPYARSATVGATAGSVSEPMGLTKKRVLLRILSNAEMERRGFTVSMQQIQEMSDDLRLQNGLVDHSLMLEWLGHCGLSMQEYCEILYDWQCVLHLEDVMSGAIEAQLRGQRAFASMRQWRRA